MNNSKVAGHTTASPKRLPCNCEHDYQDKKCGKGIRVHNPAKDKKMRCTVCGNTKVV